MQQCRRLSRRERHVKPVERLRQSFADRFNICLLARPAPEESSDLLLLWQRIESLNFCARKETPRNILAREVCANMFNVNSKLGTQCKCQQSHLMRA